MKRTPKSVIEHITKAKELRKPILSFEITPPERGESFDETLERVDSLAKFNPAFISITSRAAQIEYEDQQNGSLKIKTKRKYPGTLGLCGRIHLDIGIDTVPHLLCQGFSKQETEDAIIDSLVPLLIKDVFAVRGDISRRKDPDKDYNPFAVDLVKQIIDMNKGIYLEGVVNKTPTNFKVGVACYPEKHYQAPNLEYDIEHLKKKIEAGASWALTQMFFDNSRYYSFLKKCRDNKIKIPIMPGLSVITSEKQLTNLPTKFKVEIPQDLVSRILSDKNNTAEIGIDWAYNQAQDLIKNGVPGIHFFVYGIEGEDSMAAIKVLKKLYKKFEFYKPSKT